MRLQVINAYPGENWRKKVMKMPVNQLVAIYNSIQRREAKRIKEEAQPYHQIDIFEYLQTKGKTNEKEHSGTINNWSNDIC